MRLPLLFALPAIAAAQPAALDSVVEAMNQYRITPHIVYQTSSGYDSKLDVWAHNTTRPRATLVYIHGGGWQSNYYKEQFTHFITPYMLMGWNIVNVEYRPSSVALAPAAVEDCLCALRWVYRNATQYNFDTNRIVVTGHSAGGHLSLTTGMTPASAELDRQCPGTEELKVAAVVNWFGITDVDDLLDGTNTKTYAVKWLASLPDRHKIAARVSPLSYVRPGLPAIITIHGDADPTVPYTHATRLHDALTKAGVTNQLVTVPGGKHGYFNDAETKAAYRRIFAFLAKLGLKEE